MYRNLINQAERYENDKVYVDELQNGFIEYVKLFNHLIPQEEEPDPLAEPLEEINP